MLITLDRERRKPLQQQIFDQICAHIVSGRFGPGSRLPSSRELSRTLGVSRNTVALAYDRLSAEGYTIARCGSRTCVSVQLPDHALSIEPVIARHTTAEYSGHALAPSRPTLSVRQPAVFHARKEPIDFWVPQADPRSFPLKTWKRLVTECLAHAGSNLTDYGDPSGLKELKRAIADQVARARGIVTTPDAVFIMAGAQLAMNTVARLFLRGSEPVVVENPCNQGAAYLFESYCAGIVPLPVDGDGMITSLLPPGPVSLAYVTPSHQFPLGMQLNLKRRHELLRWAAAAGAYIIEDDYDGHFAYDGAPLPALKALRDDLVIYLGTFSKTLGAGLRIGYAILPPQLIETTRATKALLDNGQAWLEQAALAKFIERGSFDKHLRLIRQVYRARRDRLVSELDFHFGRVLLSGTQCGTHVAWHLPDHFPPAQEIQDLARRRRLGVYTVDSAGGHEFGGGEMSGRILLLGYGSLAEHQIEEGVSRLAAALDGLRVSEMRPQTPWHRAMARSDANWL